MKVSERDVDLKSFFPFSCCEAELRRKAGELGKCVRYSAGETVLLSGSPAKHCGMITEGQAVAFKLDGTGRRYQICLEEGCFIGLETLEPDSSYNAKITALTDLEVYFWNRTGMDQLQALSPEFTDAMRMLNGGRTYQEQWLIPETDITDPVLCSQQTFWLSAAAPAFLILPVLLICLAACGMLIRQYPAAWILAFALLGAGGMLLYRNIMARLNERVIATSKNLILIPRNSDDKMTVARLSGIQSLNVERNLFERLIDVGRISFLTEDQRFATPKIYNPVQTASLVRDFAERASLGRFIPLMSGNKALKRVSLRGEAESADVRTGGAEERPVTPEAGAGSAKPESRILTNFEPIEFHAHWALLVRRIFGPLLFIAAALIAAHFFRTNINADFIRTILFAAAGIAAIVICLRVSEWRSNRFRIEEDCVRDYYRKPFSSEEMNVAMNHKIQSVRFEKSGFFQVLFNYGTVYILAGEGELTFDYVSDPKRIQKLIMDACSRYEDKRRMEEEERRKAYIADLVSEIRGEGDPEPEDPPYYRA